MCLPSHGLSTAGELRNSGAALRPWTGGGRFMRVCALVCCVRASVCLHASLSPTSGLMLLASPVRRCLCPHPRHFPAISPPSPRLSVTL